MGIYANYTNGKLIVSKKPVTINNVTYDPSVHEEDIKGFKWFKNKSEAYKHFGLERKIHMDFDN